MTDNDTSAEIFEDKTVIDQPKETSMMNSLMTNSTMWTLRKFDPNGPVNVQNWLKYFEKKTADLTNEDRVNIISDYLEGSALDVFIEEVIEFTDWDQIKLKFIELFAEKESSTLSDFTDLKFIHCKDLRDYFNKKLTIGKRLELSTTNLIDGLTDGLPERKKELFLMRDISSTTEWLRLAQRVVKPFPQRGEMPREPIRHAGQDMPNSYRYGRGNFRQNRGGGNRQPYVNNHI